MVQYMVQNMVQYMVLYMVQYTLTPVLMLRFELHPTFIRQTPCCSAGVEVADCLELSVVHRGSWGQQQSGPWKPNGLVLKGKESQGNHGEPHISWQKHAKKPSSFL